VEGEEFYMHETENHGPNLKLQKEYIADMLKDEEIKHDTVITQAQLELLERYGIKLSEATV
jgi:hypothetical protein